MAGFAGIAWRVLVVLLSACASVPELPEAKYDKSAGESLYRLDSWGVDGRLSLSGKNDSWSANIVWRHVPGKERIKLSGPLGQGATVIEFAGDVVSIDRGNGDVQRSNDPEAFLGQQLGMPVPVRSLRYWVIGLPQPDQESQMTDDGFVQSGWLVGYRQMQSVGGRMMPRKISVANGRVKLKLFIDSWMLDGEKPR